MSNLPNVTDQDFTAEVIESGTPVLVDFWAEWCRPCHMVAPEVEAVSEKLAGRLKVVKLDIDENQITAAKYGVVSIPTLILFSAGQEALRLVGARPRTAILAELETVLGAQAS
ncbi:MAG TPA: thioredoxin [Actinomycetota bacterium]|nr:thioredoxin [Actinomycetota bacterium]